MTRRSFTHGAAAVGLSAAAATTTTGAPAAQERAWLELRHFRLRNTVDAQVQRLSAFLEGVWMPAMERAGAGPAGFFSSVIAADAPFVTALVSYPSAAAMGAALEKMERDEEYRKGLEAAYSKGALYTRVETWLLRAFDSVPRVEGAAPAAAPETKRPPRVFEMRIYESPDASTLKRKIGMFNSGEIGIFRRLGMDPVFFGEMLAGPRMPNLVYMLGFENLAAREKAWSAFGADPEWARMKAAPGLSDGEVVSNISNSILRPLPFSKVR